MLGLILKSKLIGLSSSGVAVYYFSPLWPYSVSVNIALDSGSPTFVSLLDPAYIGHENTAGGKETVMSDIRWSVSGLPNGTHTVVISVPGGGGFVIVDGFTCVRFISRKVGTRI